MNTRRQYAGFSLIETMASLAILAVAALGLMGSMVVASGANSISRRRRVSRGLVRGDGQGWMLQRDRAQRFHGDVPRGAHRAAGRDERRGDDVHAPSVGPRRPGRRPLAELLCLDARGHRPMKRAPPASGFTLIEITVSSALFALISAIALSMVVGMNNSSTRVRVVGDAQTGGRLGLEGVPADIRAAGGGAASGQVGIATGGWAARRIPVIWAGPRPTVTAHGGQKSASTSMLICFSE